MKISFKNVSDLRLKAVICAFVFVLGLFFIVLFMIAAGSPLEYQTVNGIYDSYREDRVGMHTTKGFLTVETSDFGQTEYQIQQIAFRAFDKKYFLQEVAVGDSIQLTLQEGEIVSIRTNEKSYMNKADSLTKQRNNSVMGYCIGGGFIVISILAFSTLITVRKGRRSNKRRR